MLTLGIYLSNNITYKRRHDLEGQNGHLVIIDIQDSKRTRLISHKYLLIMSILLRSFEKANLKIVIGNQKQYSWVDE